MKLNSSDLRGNLLARMKCKCPQQTGSMFLVPFDTEKQLEGPPDRPLLCPLSHISGAAPSPAGFKRPLVLVAVLTHPHPGPLTLL